MIRASGQLAPENFYLSISLPFRLLVNSKWLLWRSYFSTLMSMCHKILTWIKSFKVYLTFCSSHGWVPFVSHSSQENLSLWLSITKSELMFCLGSIKSKRLTPFLSKKTTHYFSHWWLHLEYFLDWEFACCHFSNCYFNFYSIMVTPYLVVSDHLV